MKATTAHELTHNTAILKYRDKIIGTANAQHLDLENVKYTIAFNKDRTRAWHFWTSKDIFYKWEADHKEPEAVELELEAVNKELSPCISTFTPIEVKEKTW